MDFLPFKEKILFYGATLAGAALLWACRDCALRTGIRDRSNPWQNPRASCRRRHQLIPAAHSKSLDTCSSSVRRLHTSLCRSVKYRTASGGSPPPHCAPTKGTIQEGIIGTQNGMPPAQSGETTPYLLLQRRSGGIIRGLPAMSDSSMVSPGCSAMGCSPAEKGCQDSVFIRALSYFSVLKGSLTIPKSTSPLSSLSLISSPFPHQILYRIPGKSL